MSRSVLSLRSHPHGRPQYPLDCWRWGPVHSPTYLNLISPAEDACFSPVTLVPREPTAQTRESWKKMVFCDIHSPLLAVLAVLARGKARPLSPPPPTCSACVCSLARPCVCVFVCRSEDRGSSIVREAGRAFFPPSPSSLFNSLCFIVSLFEIYYTVLKGSEATLSPSACLHFVGVAEKASQLLSAIFLCETVKP